METEQVNVENEFESKKKNPGPFSINVSCLKYTIIHIYFDV